MVDAATAATVPLLPFGACGGMFFVELARVTGIEAAGDVPSGVPAVAWDDRFLMRSDRGPRGAAKAVMVRTPQGDRAIPADHVGRVRETPSSDILPLPLAVRSRCHPALVGVVLPDATADAGARGPAGWVLDPVRLADARAAGAVHLPPERLGRRIADALPKRSPDAMRCLVAFDAGLGDAEADVRFALSATQVVCLSPAQTVTPVPTATDDLAGLAVWCGCPVPVVDLAAQFRPQFGPSAGAPQEMLLLARDHDTRELIGFLAACQVELIRPSVDLRPIRCPFDSPAAAAAFASGERRFVVPRLSAIINSPAVSHESAACR